MLAGLMLLSASSLASCSDTKTPADDSTSVASTDAELTTPETKAWDALPIENFDKFVEELHARGLTRLLEIKQAAFDRYNNK